MKVNNKPVVDAVAPLTVKIGSRDRTGAEIRNPERCVVARAVRRTLNGDIVGVKIGAQKAYVEYGDRVVRYQVPKETREMVRAYDAAGFYPTGVTARLVPVPPTHRLGTQNKPSGKKSKGGTAAPSIRNASRPWLRHLNQPAPEG